MKAFSNPDDLVDEVDEAKSHIISRVIFWRKKWAEFRPPLGISWNWTAVPFNTDSASKVPLEDHGLYSFVLCPGIASHPKNNFVLYIGKADKTTLRQRFHHYLLEKKKVKRPHICYALNKYEGHLEFCFTKVGSQQDIQAAEDALLVALMPPYNEDFPASVSQIIVGLR
ncbi:MAG: hypothetical protein JO170_33130 [Verrucomicrobia bacterium]|nr:hypothetical protein [Verrucomicrobiota bacterium]